MRILGIDYGQKHIGLAVGDTDLKIATPFRTIETRNWREILGAAIHDEKIEQIVVGLPLSFRMEETAASRRVRQFGSQVESSFTIPVAYENEVLTSDQVKRARPRVTEQREARRALKSKSHASAAALILQSFLDRE